MPTRPDESRNPISFSPKISKRTGSRSATSSLERQAGIQYSLMKRPIAVLEPTLVSVSLSLGESIFNLPGCCSSTEQRFDYSISDTSGNAVRPGTGLTGYLGERPTETDDLV